MKVAELINENTEVRKILERIKQEENKNIKKHCRYCDGNCISLGGKILTKLDDVTNKERREEEINDPDFSWEDYKEELQLRLIELGKKFPIYQDQLKGFAQKLNQVESESEG
jgi:hypothetical protein